MNPKIPAFTPDWTDRTPILLLPSRALSSGSAFAFDSAPMGGANLKRQIPDGVTVWFHANRIGVIREIRGY